MTCAALYARYSDEKQSEASIEDQFRLCREHAARERWQIVGSYEDAAISGASTILRPGIQRLMRDARHGEFNILLAEALDRISRDQADVATLYKHLKFAGVTIVTLAEGEISELHVGLKGTMNALFLKDLAMKTHRGLRGRVEKGKAGGGLCYGYRVVKKFDANGEPIRGDREIIPEEAEIVRRIFGEFASGKSPKAIAVDLNRDGIPGPLGRAWGDTSIRGHVSRGTASSTTSYMSASLCGTVCASSKTRPPVSACRASTHPKSGSGARFRTDLDSPYHAHTLRLLIDEMGVRGLAALVFSCNAAEWAGAVISRLTGYQVDAVIALAAPFDSQIVESCRAMDKPLVLMNDHDGSQPVGTVASDSRRGGALVAAHLIEQGARRFGFFAGEDRTHISRDREAGYSAHLRRSGFTCSRRAASGYDYASACKAAAVLLADPPDAIFCANDTLAQALIDTARLRFGLSVPGDLMVAGYDNSALAARWSYALTSVDHDLERMAVETVAAVMELIAAPAPFPLSKVVEPRLVIRASTRAAFLPSGDL